MSLNEIEEKQTELLKKVQVLFTNKNRTQRDMDALYDEIRTFEKERNSLIVSKVFGESEVDDV
jgi:hypothetical protein